MVLLGAASFLGVVLIGPDRSAVSSRAVLAQAASGGDPFGYFGAPPGDATPRSEPKAPSDAPIRLRLFQTDARSGGVETPGERFDAASLRYVGFDFQVAGSGGGFSLGDCYVERLRTGVRLIPGMRINMQGDGGARITGMLGADQPAWLPGEYKLICEGKGITVEPRRFSIRGRWRGEPGLKIVAGKLPIAGATPEDLRLFHQEEAGSPAPMGSRNYWSTVRGAPRYIAAELALALEAAPRPISFKYTCNYFTDEGGLIGRESTEVEIPAGHTKYYMWVAWGNGSGRYWRTGNHYVECDVDGVFAAGQFFAVKRG